MWAVKNNDELEGYLYDGAVLQFLNDPSAYPSDTNKWPKYEDSTTGRIVRFESSDQSGSVSAQEDADTSGDEYNFLDCKGITVQTLIGGVTGPYWISQQAGSGEWPAWEVRKMKGIELQELREYLSTSDDISAFSTVSEAELETVDTRTTAQMQSFLNDANNYGTNQAHWPMCHHTGGTGDRMFPNPGGERTQGLKTGQIAVERHGVTKLTGLNIEVRSSENVWIYDGEAKDENYLFTIDATSVKSGEFPFDVGTQKMEFRMYKDIQQDGYTEDDVEILYGGQPQMDELTFSFRITPKTTCPDAPKIEIVYPLNNLMCQGDVYVEMTTWDDCNREEVYLPPVVDAKKSNMLPKDDKYGIYLKEKVPIDGNTKIEAMVKADREIRTYVTVGQGQSSCKEEGFSYTDDHVSSMTNLLRDFEQRQDLSRTGSSISSGSSSGFDWYRAVNDAAKAKPHYAKIEKYANEYGVPVLLAVAVAGQESNYVHCSPEQIECPDDKIIKGDNGKALGLYQINRDSHADCHQTLANSKRESGSICKVSKCDGKDVHNLDCNIAAAMNLLKKKYDEIGSGCTESSCNTCTNSAGKFYASYRGWDAALRGYNGLGCAAGPNGYVEEVQEKARGLA
ncbi:MAG: hypothetical protein KJ709_00615 [Nanoarchaeota archaeon]|nr:hypothetical protein [Nanoarchaeota archaeon]